MKFHHTVTIGLLFFCNVALATPRGLSERINGVGYLPTSETVLLDQPIEGLDGTPKTSVTLSTPNRPGQGNRLKLDEKRSVVKIDEQSIKDLDQDLQLAILEVVNNKSSSLQERGVTFPEEGLANFHVFGNFRAARTPNDASDWFIAIVPISVEITEVIFQMEWFGGGAGAHTQIRMVSDYPIVAIPQSSDTYEPYVFANYNNQGDMIFTLQATRVQGGEQDWEPLKGVMGEFGIALQIFETRTLALDQIKRSVVKEYQLSGLSRKQKKNIFLEALQLSHSQDQPSIYNTVFASCVTYALKALKAGIPSIQTSWFNPYSIVEKVSTAHGQGLDFTGTMNDSFGPLIDGEVMTLEKIIQNNQQLTSLVNSLRRPILENKSFDQLIQKIALFIVEEGFTYSQVEEFMQAMKQPNSKVASSPQTRDGRRLTAEINRIWNENFPDRSIEDFFKALQSLQTQP